jgi:hypothetical protein
MCQGVEVAIRRRDSRDEIALGAGPVAGPAAAAVVPARVQLMLQLQESGGNQAVGRLLSQEYPFADRINAALGRTVPLRGVVDPAACAEAGVPAFTEGGVTHFADARPGLHVAAHEAAHVLQHSGQATDAGLGAEGHAGAVADAVVAGRSATDLVGAGGARVPSGRHNYTPADGKAQYRGVSPGSVFTRLADTGEAWSRGPHLLYATAAMIEAAAATLGPRSGVRLTADSSEQQTVEAPDGSGRKALSRLKVDIAAGGAQQTLPSDCRRAALEVLGLGAQNPAASVQFGGPTVLVKPVDPRNTIAETLFVQKRITETPDYATLSAAEQRQIIDQAKTDFGALPADEKEKLKHSPLADAAAAKLGLDAAAQPGVGEAYSIHRAGAAPDNEFEYHFAAVILAPGQDRVTMENSGGGKGERTDSWKMEMYGPASKHQSFHEEWARIFGADAHTVAGRDETVRTPDAAAGYPQLPTAALLVLYRDAKDPDQVGALEAELRKRTVGIQVAVDQLEDHGWDEVFVRLHSGEKKIDTEMLWFTKGADRVFKPVPLADLLPIGKLIVEVIEFDLIGNDRIGTIPWPVPLLDQAEVKLAAGDARYRVSLTATPPR